MMPSSGTIHVLNAAPTSAGRATHTMNSASLGKSPAIMAKRHPIVVLRSLARGSGVGGGHVGLRGGFADGDGHAERLCDLRRGGHDARRADDGRNGDEDVLD